MMQRSDSRRRRSRARFLRKQKRPRWCAVFLWILGLPYLLLAVGIVWEATLIPRDTGVATFYLGLLYLPFFAGFFAHPIVGCAAMVTAFWGYARLMRKVRSHTPALVACLLFLAPVLAICITITRLPLGLAFSLNRDAFDERLITELQKPSPPELPLAAQKVGAYHVRGIVRDARSGVYFLLPQQGFIIYPQSRESYAGFVHDPPGRWNPFGRSPTRLRHLEGNWYFFRATSD